MDPLAQSGVRAEYPVAVSDGKTLDVGHLAARLIGVTLPMGLTIDEVIVQGENLHLEASPFAATLPKPASLDVRISADSLADFLEKKAPGGLKDFQIQLKGGEIFVEARATMIISINVGAVCKLRIEDGKELYVDLVRVEAIGGSGIHNIVQKQLDSINPVLKAQDLPLDATLETVECDNDWIVLHGTLAPK